MRLLALLLLLSPLTALAQTEPEPGFGLSASVQAGQFDLALPYWAGSSFALVPSVGFEMGQDVGFDVRLGVAARFYQRVGQIAPYGGLRAGLLFFSPAENEFGPDPESTMDFLIGVMYGAEAFLLPQFSLGVEAQLNATKSAEASMRFGNPGNLNLNTGAAVTATVYF